MATDNFLLSSLKWLSFFFWEGKLDCGSCKSQHGPEERSARAKLAAKITVRAMQNITLNGERWRKGLLLFQR